MAPHAEEAQPFTTLPSKMASKQQIQATSDTTTSTIPDPITQTKPTLTRFRHGDVLPHRISSKTAISKGVASFSSAEMFKCPQELSKPKVSKSYYHSHLTREAKARKSSSLKGAMKFFTPQTISLCGGLPSSEYFPFEELAFEVPSSPAFSKDQVQTLRCRKDDTLLNKSDYDLQIALNYGQSMGPPQLMRFLTEHNQIVHDIPYSNWEICLTQGSTSALDITLRMLCERGDAILFEEYSFSSAIESALPMGLTPVGIKMDGKGMCPKDLENVLANWETVGKKRYGAMARPKVLYTVPTGQNPTGATQDGDRRRAIVEVCERFDVFIIEDEPYYFLQMDEYVNKTERQKSTNGHCDKNGAAALTDLGDFIDALAPSYLTLAKSGNVLRLDSFSKTLAPGSRTGWVTGPADIVERFLRASEVSAQTPSGFSMVGLYKMLEEEWGHEGFLRWLQRLRQEYTGRRNGIVDACEEHLPKNVIRWEPPMAGMFHWLLVDGSKHPAWKEHSKDPTTETERRALLIEIEEQIFQAAAAKNVLIARGSWFRSEKDNSPEAKAVNGGEVIVNGHVGKQQTAEVNTTIYFRMTFAAASQDNIAEAVRRFGETLKEEFQLA